MFYNSYQTDIDKTNQPTVRFITDILAAISIILTLCTVFVIDRNLVNGIVAGKYFWFYAAVAGLAVAVVPAMVVRRGASFRFSAADALLLMFCCLAVGITFFHTGRMTTKSILLVFLLMFWFLLRICLSGKSGLIQGLLMAFFVFAGLAEAIWGLRQLYGFTVSQHALFKTTGSFFNPGPYAGWLAMVFPMALGYAATLFGAPCGGNGTASHSMPQNHHPNHTLNMRDFCVHYGKGILGVCTALGIVLVLPAAMSRASWLAALGGAVFIAVAYYARTVKWKAYTHKYRKQLWLLTAVALIAVAAAAVGLYRLKADSASGRLLIWKTAAKTIAAHPEGVGLGNFGGAYADVQATYLATAGTAHEKYVAGGVEYAFNEYLQIGIETGIAGLLLFLAFAVYVLYTALRRRRYLPAGSLVSLLIFASMSYPLNVLPFAIAFVCLAALCVAPDAAAPPAHAGTPLWRVAACVCLPVWVTIGFAAPHLCAARHAYSGWNNTQPLYGANSRKEAANAYLAQYPYLRDEVKFLFDYAQALSKTAQYEASNRVLAQAMQISGDPMLCNIAGKNYQALQQYTQAETYFWKAAHITPSRLYPYYLLTKLYHETGQYGKACEMAAIVQTKEPKVHSTAVDEMREEVKRLCEK